MGKSRLLAGLAAGGALACASSSGAAAEEPHAVSLEYAGSIAGLRVLRAEFDATLGPDAYAGEVMFQSAGLAGFFKTARVEGAGSGVRGAGGLFPERYTHIETTGRKTRRIELTYGEDDVAVEAAPPFGSLGDPAPTPGQKRAALDPVSAILAIMTSAGDDPCDRTIPVFDSKLRYDLEFQPAGAVEDFRVPGYRGAALHCRVYYRPIAGYDPEDLAEPEVYATPINFHLAEVAPDVWVPARVDARFDLAFLRLTVAVRLTKVETDLPDTMAD